MPWYSYGRSMPVRDPNPNRWYSFCRAGSWVLQEHLGADAVEERVRRHGQGVGHRDVAVLGRLLRHEVEGVLEQALEAGRVARVRIDRVRAGVLVDGLGLDETVVQRGVGRERLERRADVVATLDRQVVERAVHRGLGEQLGELVRQDARTGPTVVERGVARHRRDLAGARPLHHDRSGRGREEHGVLPRVGGVLVVRAGAA